MPKESFLFFSYIAIQGKNHKYSRLLILTQTLPVKRAALKVMQEVEYSDDVMEHCLDDSGVENSVDGKVAQRVLLLVDE